MEAPPKPPAPTEQVANRVGAKPQGPWEAKTPPVPAVVPPVTHLASEGLSLDMGSWSG